MIPLDYIVEWRASAPWPTDIQVEQDLVISRALVEIFRVSQLRDALAFRGGTALHKLYLRPAARYSEDIDLVQVRAEPIGPTMSALRSVLDSWLGEPQYKRSEGRVTLLYRFTSEGMPARPMRLKVEINSREHFALHSHVLTPFEVASRWFSAGAEVRTFDLDELLATKLRALHQRKKVRDLFDLWHAHESASIDPERIVAAFCEYLERGGHRVSRAQFESTLAGKMADKRFGHEMAPLLRNDVAWDPVAAWELIAKTMAAHIPGDPWKRARPRT